MIPLWDIGAPSSRVMGFEQNQNRMAFPTWSFAMERHPPRRIIELGAYNGGFTTCLAVHAYRIKCEVHSFELAQCPNEDWQDLSAFLGIKFYKGDLFESPHVDTIRGLLQSPGITYLLCDNGCKVKEFNFFAEYLKPGDVIGAHDYCNDSEIWCGSEIIPAQVAESVAKHALSPFMQEHFDLAAWLVYKKG